VEIVSHSGSPLLLNLKISDPDAVLRAVTVETTSSSAIYRIPPDPERTELTLSLSPFLGPGVYDVRIFMDVEMDGNLLRIEESAQVGFVDFEFGRDNMRFGNNGDYESTIGDYGQILMDWTKDRFGDVDEIHLVPLIDYMYGVFGERSGRCYAFAGTEVRNWLYPDLLPSYYDGTYDLRPASTRVQRDMNYLQLDMAFNQFITNGYPLVPDPNESPEDKVTDILNEVSEIIETIRGGDPVVAGFMGPSLHHAMVVFGYIIRPNAKSLDLLVANNWKNEESSNIHSQDAEIVRVYEEPDENGPVFDWLYDSGDRGREIARLFRVPVMREFEHNRATLDAFVAGLHGRLVHENRAVLVVEDATGAWLTDGEKKTGYDRRRTSEELEGVVYDRVSEAHRFEYPADDDVWLEIDGDNDVMVYSYRPPSETRPEIAWIETIPASEDDETPVRRVSLDTEEVSWEVVIDSSGQN